MENGERKWCSYHQTDGHSNKDCYQQQSESANLDNKKRWCTYHNILAIRITNVFIKELVNLRTVLLLMVKTVETNIISLLTVPPLAGMQSFAVNVKEKIITMRKL